MRIKYKNKQIEVERVPISYEQLCKIVESAFNIGSPLMLIKTMSGLYKVSSAPEYSKIGSHQIQEIEIKESYEIPPPHMSSIKIDSIETCTSHEKSDSESKTSELVRSVEIDSNPKISVSCGKSLFSISVAVQTDEILYTDQVIGKSLQGLSDFSCQHDLPLVFHKPELEEFIKNEVTKYTPKPKPSSFIHKNFQCYHCSMKDIVGNRYECLICKVSFCEKCEEEIRHPHELYKYKGSSKVSESINPRDAMVKKVVSMGLGDMRLVETTAGSKNYDFNKTVEALLFSNTFK